MTFAIIKGQRISADGVIRKSQPTPGDVHINGPLTNISIAFMQDASHFIADQASPNIPVNKQSDVYFTYDRGMFNRDQMKKRAPGAESEGVGYTVGDDSYRADVWAVHHDIPDQVRANEDTPLSSDRDATELVTMQGMIRREVEWTGTNFITGVWGTERQGVAASPTGTQFLQWNDPTSTPIEDVNAASDAMLEETGFMPNVLVLNQNVWTALKNHPDIIDRVKAGQTPGGPARGLLETLAILFEVEQVLVSKAIQNTAAEGQTNVNAFIAGKNALLMYRENNPGILKPSAGYTFSWTGLLGSGAMGGRISRFRMEHLKSTRVEMEMAFDQKVVAPDLGFLFLDAVA